MAGYFDLCRCIQHIFDENAVACGRVVYKDVGDGADEVSVLDDGAAGHALDNAAGGFQQSGVCDLQQEVAAVLAVFRINFQNFHRIFPGTLIAYSGANDGGAGADASA